jgi:hypothetical protein
MSGNMAKSKTAALQSFLSIVVILPVKLDPTSKLLTSGLD